MEKTIDLTIMRMALNGKEDVLQKLVDHLATTGPGHLEEIRRHIDADAPEPLEKTAHTLKGMLASFGAEGARALAAELEKMGREQNLTGAATICDQLATELDNVLYALAESIQNGQ